MSCLLDRGLETGRLVAEDSGNSVLQPILPGEGNLTEAACPALSQGPGRLDGCQHGVLSLENDRLEQPGLEGRRNAPQQEGQSRPTGDQVCALSTASEQHVSQRRLCDGASDRGGESDGKAAAALGGGASHQPRRDGQQDHQPDAVRDQCGTQTVRAWPGHKTDLVRVVPFHHVGKVWCLRVPTGAFVAVRNGVAFPTGNSGFPKAVNAARSIDKAARGVLGKADPDSPNHGKFKGGCSDENERGQGFGAGPGQFMAEAGVGGRYEPQTPEAAEWEGWAYGTQTQKPALEPIYLGQKPFDCKTGAANLLKHGVGAVNIDGCRVGTEQLSYAPKGTSTNANMVRVPEHRIGKAGDEVTVQGRHPANLILDGSPEVVAMFPDSKSCAMKASTARAAQDEPGSVCYGTYGGQVASKDIAASSGSAARFFHHFPPDADPLFYHPKAGKADRAGSKHPTVKPIALMQYLVRHITPPGGVVLDPFAGSGTTAEAARREGFDCILMEAEPEYLDFLRDRFGVPVEQPAPAFDFDDILGEAMPTSSTSCGADHIFGDLL